MNNDLTRDRRSYPFLYRTEYKFDLDILREEAKALEEVNGWNDMKHDSDLVKNLIKGRERLTKAFANDDGEYHDYEQMIVTNIEEEPDVEGGVGAGKFEQYKLDMKRAASGLDESKYGQFRDVMDVAPYTKKILNSLPDPLARVRYAKMKPHFAISPHIDYNTTYGMRYHIALHTNDKCEMGFRRNKSEEFETFHIPADGHLYFFNQGFEHYATNYGNEERVHMVIGLSGQSLMEPYLEHFGRI